MSDGPHRSLRLRQGWKELAFRADRSAFTSEEVSSALIPALQQDWRSDVPSAVLSAIGTALEVRGAEGLLPPQPREVEALRRISGGTPLSEMLIDYAVQAACEGRRGEAAFDATVKSTLFEQAHRQARSIEEHFCRKSDPARARLVRARITSSITSDIIAVAASQIMIGGRSRVPSRPVKQTALDDGVPL